MGLVVVVPFILPESCRWLISKGEGEKSVEIIKKIAKMNKREVLYICVNRESFLRF